MSNPFEIKTNSAFASPKGELDWDESALDTQKERVGFFDPERPTPRLFWLKTSIGVLMLVLLIRLIGLQLLQGKALVLLSDQNRLRSQIVLAPRGKIFDRNNQILAENIPSFSLVVVPADLPKEDLPQEIQKLATLFELNEQELKDKLSSLNRASYESVVLKQDLSQQQSILFSTKSAEFPGFSVSSIPIRQYTEGPIFSHALGYAGIVSESELSSLSKKGYHPSDFIGKAGVELSYESYLRGENGQKQIEVDSSGRPVKTLGTVEPKPGDSLILNIDKDLQEQIYKGFQNFSPKVKGAAVALNPKTGEVLALLSLPGYDNNLFAHGISGTDYQTLLNDKTLPLFNRVISGTYPPGSTVKPMVAVAGLEEKTITESTIIVDRGSLVIPNQYDPSKNFTFLGWKAGGLGPMNVVSAIAQSSDIYFYTVAGGHSNTPGVQGLGAERLASYYHKFGLGAPTGIDLQGEKTGLVPDPTWKAEYFKDDAILSKWYLGDTYHIGIGQGDLLVTPLQVATWTSVIANGGLAYKPRLLNKVVDDTGKTVFESSPEILVSKFASDETISIVQKGMRATVTSGSGRQLASLPITAAGKTGTSQFDGSDPTRTHAWFTAYAPFEDPQIVITILVEAGGEGHAAAVPIAKNALLWWAQNRYKK